MPVNGVKRVMSPIGIGRSSGIEIFNKKFKRFIYVPADAIVYRNEGWSISGRLVLKET